MSIPFSQIYTDVLDDENRVISMRATVKAIANDVNGDLSKYIGVRTF